MYDLFTLYTAYHWDFTQYFHTEIIFSSLCLLFFHVVSCCDFCCSLKLKVRELRFLYIFMNVDVIMI